MKRILVLIKGLGRGGAEQLLVSAAPYLDRTQFEYEIAYLLPWKDALVPALRATGLKVHCLEHARGPAWMFRLKRLVQEREIDLVHAHSPMAGIGARFALCGPQSPRIVYTEHNLWNYYHPATRWGNLATFGLNDHVFAVSKQVQDSIRYPPQLKFLSMPPVETLYHGVDPEVTRNWGSVDGVRKELGIGQEALVVGTVANFRAQKGYEHLLDAALRVRRRIPGVRFVLIGQGPLEVAMRRRSERLGLEGTVIFTGYREDVPRLAGAFDVFTLSSLYEGLSIALVEAMVLRKPAVATAVGGIPEVIEHGKQGLLVAPGDAKGLAD
jgi:glycosyltransferase involved in cell wall biosynthesis